MRHALGVLAASGRALEVDAGSPEDVRVVRWWQGGPMDATHAEHEVRALLAVMDELELQWLLRPETDLETVFASHLNATVDRWRRDPS